MNVDESTEGAVDKYFNIGSVDGITGRDSGRYARKSITENNGGRDPRTKQRYKASIYLINMRTLSESAKLYKIRSHTFLGFGPPVPPQLHVIRDQRRRRRQRSQKSLLLPIKSIRRLAVSP
jgi:hypothetical protein